jgi:ribosome-associated heat shock protein Hsp15
MTDRIRIDKWLWHARFYKTRALAQHAAVKGRVRRNDVRVEKASAEVKIGDILTLGRGREVVVVRIIRLWYPPRPCERGTAALRDNRRR